MTVTTPRQELNIERWKSCVSMLAHPHDEATGSSSPSSVKCCFSMRVGFTRTALVLRLAMWAHTSSSSPQFVAPTKYMEYQIYTEVYTVNRCETCFLPRFSTVTKYNWTSLDAWLCICMRVSPIGTLPEHQVSILTETIILSFFVCLFVCLAARARDSSARRQGEGLASHARAFACVALDDPVRCARARALAQASHAGGGQFSKMFAAIFR